jgi:hypothetical protein
MLHELIAIIDKVESLTCKAHGKKASIKIVDDIIEISGCCNEFKQHLERKIEYEFYEEFATDETEVSAEVSKVA